jgi:thioredoxin 1
MIRTPLLLLAIVTVSSCDEAKQLAKKAQAVAAKEDKKPAESPGPEFRELPVIGYESFIKTPNRLIVVQFHENWCPYSRESKKALQAVSAEFAGRATVAVVDTENDPEFSRRERVTAVPLVRFYRDGKLLHQMDGIVPGHEAENFREAFAKFSKDIPVTDPEKAPEGGQAQPQIQPMKKDWLPPGIERR